MTRAHLSPTWFWLLLFAALLARAVLPQGYMPERSGSGPIEIKVCGSHDVWQVPLEKDSSSGEGKQRADQPCAFAGFAAATPPAALPSLPLPANGSLSFVEQPTTAKPAASPRLLPPATGPPLPA